MQVESTVEINPGFGAFLSQKCQQALAMTTEALHTRVVQAQVIPRDTGLLQGEAFNADYNDIESGSTSLVHDTPYARRLYYHPEYHFDTTENPNAKGEWYEDWLPGGAEDDFVATTYNNILRGLMS